MTRIAEVTPGAGPPQTGTRLITSPRDEQSMTLVRETDARTALLRGLAEYLMTLEFDAFGGRQVQFRAVNFDWAEPEDEALLPAASVLPEGSGIYTARGLGQDTSGADRIGTATLVCPSQYDATISVMVWATDPEQRIALCAMVEDGVAPVKWMPGFWLELPHYHGVRAEFGVVNNTYLDDTTTAQQLRRKADFQVLGQLPVVRVHDVPQGDVRASTITQEGAL